MHEQSETIKRGKSYFNVYGKGTARAGMPIPKRYTFEKTAYPNLQEAVGSAIVRSDLAERVTDDNYQNRVEGHNMAQHPNGMPQSKWRE